MSTVVALAVMFYIFLNNILSTFATRANCAISLVEALFRRMHVLCKMLTVSALLLLHCVFSLALTLRLFYLGAVTCPRNVLRISKYTTNEILHHTVIECQAQRVPAGFTRSCRQSTRPCRLSTHSCRLSTRSCRLPVLSDLLVVWSETFSMYCRY